MNSMTGYGRGEATNGDISVTVEMRSVNNRFRDLQIRVPRSYMVLEPRIQKGVRDHIHRGRVEIFVRRTSREGEQSIAADLLLSERYHAVANQVAKRLQYSPNEVPLDFILRQQGVLTIQDNEPDALTEWSLVSTALDVARDDLLNMRAEEGGALLKDLSKHLGQMLRLRSEVAEHCEDIGERLLKRLNQRITRLIGDRVDPRRLEQEAAILADKADVSEELARILSHCQQLEKIFHDTEPVGRKIDFLLQELNREINTIGSKAAEHPISSRVVEMKSVLERLREQSANVE